MNELCKPQRELYWSELDADMKIKKLSNELNRTQYELNRIGKIVMKLMEHKHSKGRLVTNLSQWEGDGYCFRAYDVNK